MTQWPDAFCLILSFMSAFLEPNNFMASLLSVGWKRACSWFLMKLCLPASAEPRGVGPGSSFGVPYNETSSTPKCTYIETTFEIKQFSKDLLTIYKVHSIPCFVRVCNSKTTPSKKDECFQLIYIFNTLFLKLYMASSNSIHKYLACYIWGHISTNIGWFFKIYLIKPTVETKTEQKLRPIWTHKFLSPQDETVPF